jgi:hypothetical protein
VLPPGRMTSGIVRRGDRIWRPMGPWSPAVHEYLRHLESAGFAGAPRLLGTEGDREILSYLPGEVAADPHWQPGHRHHLPAFADTDEALCGVARLLRQLHDAAADFSPARTGYRFRRRPPLPGEIICHGDLGPWNTVYSDGVPVGFIDWDAAGPAAPLADLAHAAWAFVPLGPHGDDQAMAGRLARFVTAYGLADPKAILPELAAGVLAGLEEVRYVTPDPAAAADRLEIAAWELRWIHRTIPALATALDRA